MNVRPLDDSKSAFTPAERHQTAERMRDGGPVMATEGRVPAPRQPREPATLLCSEGFRRAVRGGRPGVVVRLRLPGYRSLPLSCIREIAVSIDGVAADLSDALLLINGYGLPLRELPERTDVWWWVLDPGELFFALSATLEPGVHEVRASMSTLVPYATGGRTTKTESDSRRLTLDPAV